MPTATTKPVASGNQLGVRAGGKRIAATSATSKASSPKAKKCPAELTLSAMIDGLSMGPKPMTAINNRQNANPIKISMPEGVSKRDRGFIDVMLKTGRGDGIDPRCYGLRGLAE